MSRRPARTKWYALLPLVCLGLLVACENTFDPFEGGTSASPFYLFGYLDTEADTQYVRVQAVRAAYELPASEPLNAQVFSFSDDSRGTTVWEERLVLLDDGTYGSVFFATFRAEPATTYRIEVTRDDGAASSSATIVPARPQPYVDSVRVADDSITQRVTWRGTERQPQLARVTYFVSRSSQIEPFQVEIDYWQSGRMERDGYAVSLTLSIDRQTIEQRTGTTMGDPVALYGVAMTIQIPSEEWQDPLANHVDNGTGFLGAIATFRTEWTLPTHIVSLLEMEDRQELGGNVLER